MLGKTYTFSQAELNGRGDLAKGADKLDVRAIELAFEKHLQQSSGGKLNLNSALPMTKGLSLLTGQKALYRDNYKFTDRDIKAFNNATGTIVSHYGKTKLKIGNTVLYGNHGYSVVGSDASRVYVVNPWDTSKTIALSHSQFKDFFTDFAQV